MGDARRVCLLHGEDRLVLVELVGNARLVEQRDCLGFAEHAPSKMIQKGTVPF